MEVRIIQNKKQALAFCESIMQGRLPLKVAVQDIYPTRSLESNAYLWGIVYEYISRASGHSPEEVHRAYKKQFNFRHDLRYNDRKRLWVWIMGVATTTSLDTREIWDYIMKVRADAEIELDIVIPLPNECFINELEFKEEK